MGANAFERVRLWNWIRSGN